MRIGYACINTQLPTSSRTCRLANATPDRLLDLTGKNLSALGDILAWNAAHGVHLFRISSDVIPFGSHPVNNGAWRSVYQAQLLELGHTALTHNMRLSMHPGQFTVLNSPRDEVVRASLAELDYHAAFLDSLGLDTSHKLVIHLGGVYGDKPASMARFAVNFVRLSHSARSRVVLENDERSYSLADALAAHKETGAPVVFDVFHHRYNPSFEGQSLRQLVERAAGTWTREDGPPKLHYSNAWPGKPPGSHSYSVDVDAFTDFAAQLTGMDVDVMLEVKDKEQSVLRLLSALSHGQPASG